MSLSPAILPVLAIFQSAFTAPTWEKAQVLIVGTLLARGRRTVTAALRVMGRGEETDFSLYHQVLNRASWSPLALSRLLLQALIKAFVAGGGGLTFVIEPKARRRLDRTAGTERATVRAAAGAPLPGQKKRAGRPPEKGARLPKLSAVLVHPQTVWEKISVEWYDGQLRVLEIVTGTALWKRAGLAPLPIRWVLVRDPLGELEPRAYFTTLPAQAAASVVAAFVLRWTIEVMFEETRAHLGIETQRQWSDLAIERTTPCLFGLFSLVALLTHALHPDGKVPLRQTAWYEKKEATFSDTLATVRLHLWGNFNYLTSPDDPDVRLIPQKDLMRLAQAVCYSH